MRVLLSLIVLVAIVGTDLRAADEAVDPASVLKLSVEPSSARLMDQRARQQLIVTAHTHDGYQYDVTAKVTFEPVHGKLLQVEPSGILRPRQAGNTVVRVHGLGHSVEVMVVIGEQTKPPPVSFTNQIMAILGKAGCNSGACHGHASGKGGFKLSLRGYDPAADLVALSKRLDRSDPEQSLILLKPTGQESHRGGTRFEKDSDFHRILKQWIAEEAKNEIGTGNRLQKITVLPPQSLMPRPGLRQRLIVQAHFADGSIRDVTDQAIFELSSEGVIEVDAAGHVIGKREGEAAVFVRFLGQMALSRFQIIRHKPDFLWTNPPTHNFIDKHIHTKLRAIQALPSDLSSDEEFLRRVSLDTIGVPPSPAEVRAFLVDSHPEKRARQIDRLLDQEEFGEVWAAYWLELSGTTSGGDSAGRKGLSTLFLWLRQVINNNLPYDQFVKALVSGKGSSLENPAVTFGVHRLPPAEVIPQLFLGVRLECAQCHDHPFDVWKQSDYRSLQTFFGDLTSKEGPGDPGSREIRTFVPAERFLPWEQGKKTTLRFLDGTTVDIPIQHDRREALANWMTGPAKKQVARAIVNRVWGKLLGRGIVDPVDDMRFSNPSVNEPLLEALTDDLIAHKFDFKHLVRTILNSRTYQLSSIPDATNLREEMNFSHARLRRLSAEQLLDSISAVTGVDELFPVSVPGTRAVQIPFHYTGSRFLSMFGRPEQRMSACECIRSHEITMPQILHLLNGESTGRKLRAEGGTLAKLLAGKHSHEHVVAELYLTVLSRSPTEREMKIGRKYLSEAKDAAEGMEDCMWALISSQEFLFNH